MRDSTNSKARGRRGYLLLEVVLALLLAGLLLGGVMSIATGALQVSEIIAQDGRRHLTQEAFLNFLGRNLAQLPGNAELDLTHEDAGSHFLSDLTFQNVPTSFSWSGQTISAEAVQISTVRRRGGDLDIVLRYYEDPILDDSDSTANVNAEPVAEITLLRDIYWFEWWARDGRTLDYTETWDVRGRLPVQMELRLKFDQNSEEIVHHFWLPPKVNPETIVRSQRRAAPQPRGTQPGGGRGGRGDRPGGDRPGGGRTNTDRPPIPRPGGGGGGGGTTRPGPPIPGQ
jgi:type II secretory pathway pseudopilin PulG